MAHPDLVAGGRRPPKRAGTFLYTARPLGLSGRRPDRNLLGPRDEVGSRFIETAERQTGEPLRQGVQNRLEKRGSFYRPFDRVATSDHQQWKTDMPHKISTSARTIMDYLEEFHSLLNGGKYLGV